MAERFKGSEYDASAGGESPVQAPVRAATLCPTYNGVRVCGRNRTEAREREWAEGTVSNCPVYRARYTFGYNSAIALELRDRVVGSGPAQQAMLSEGSDHANPPYQPFERNL